LEVWDPDSGTALDSPPTIASFFVVVLPGFYSLVSKLVVDVLAKATCGEF